MSKPWISAGDAMAEHLAKSGGRLSPNTHGKLVRVDSGPETWDIKYPWNGLELVKLRVAQSLWLKAWNVGFIGLDGKDECVMFYINLPLDTPEDEVRMIGANYMTVLNSKRQGPRMKR